MGRVEGKVAIITGGAMGLGEAMARMFVREGGRVVITDVAEEAGQRVAADLAASDGRALYLHHDVTDEARWADVVHQTVARFGRLDVLCNNAGIGYGCPPDVQTLAEWRRLMAINLDGVFLGTREAIRVMQSQDPKGGSIVNLSSIEGLIGDPMLGAYNASKGGVTLYTKSTALWCARNGTGIRVNSIHPGYIWTPMVEAYLQSSGDPEGGRKALDAMHPVGHVGQPDDIAYGFLYLASDESRFVTGSALVIDGGYTAQ